MCKANRVLIVSMTPPRTTGSQMISPRSGLGGTGHLTARDSEALDQLDGGVGSPANTGACDVGDSKGITNLGIEWHAPIDQSVFKFF
jgi:hypothetical protein